MHAASTLLRSTLLLIAGLGVALPAAAQAPPPSVLIIDQSDVSLPWWINIHSAIRSKVDSASPGRVAIYEEYLDLNRFQSPRYKEVLRGYFREKYVGKSIGVIITVGSTALEYALHLRGEFGTDVPIVFAVVEHEAAAHSKVHSNVTGTTVRLNLHDNVTAARALVPGLQQIVLVGDPFERQATRRHYRQQIVEIASQLQVLDLTGLPMGEVRKRTAALPPQTAIIYTSIFVDGEGVSFAPRQALAIVAEKANRPIVVEADTMFGYGGTGGFTIDPKLVGEAAAAQALRILAGERASEIPVAKDDFKKPVFDWRELKRWNISEGGLPPGSEVRFRPQSMWEQYRGQMLAILAVLLLQAGMIAALLFERHRRLAAELASRGHLMEVLHLNRTATAGILSASFAHEIAQPLASILSNTEAAELYLERDPPDVNEVKAILTDIRRDDERAGEIIRHLGGLLRKKGHAKLEVFDVNNAVRDALHLLEPEAKRRGVALSAAQAPGVLPVRANPVHLQQVILNLAANGMDAMSSCAAGSRKLVLQTTVIDASTAEVSVADTGMGIPPDKLKDVFKPFFTTKPHGTGIGLSISHAILQLYGGTIWAENRPGGGAVFRFSMSLAKV